MVVHFDFIPAIKNYEKAKQKTNCADV